MSLKITFIDGVELRRGVVSVGVRNAVLSQSPVLQVVIAAVQPKTIIRTVASCVADVFCVAAPKIVA
jgi:hypothetical protein